GDREPAPVVELAEVTRHEVPLAEGLAVQLLHVRVATGEPWAPDGYLADRAGGHLHPIVVLDPQLHSVYGPAHRLESGHWIVVQVGRERPRLGTPVELAHGHPELLEEGVE